MERRYLATLTLGFSLLFVLARLASGGALLVLAKYPIRSLLYAYLPGHQAALYMQAIGRHLL